MAAHKIPGKKIDRRLELQAEGSRQLDVRPRATDCSGRITRMTWAWCKHLQTPANTCNHRRSEEKVWHSVYLCRYTGSWIQTRISDFGWRIVHVTINASQSEVGSIGSQRPRAWSQLASSWNFVEAGRVGFSIWLGCSLSGSCQIFTKFPTFFFSAFCGVVLSGNFSLSPSPRADIYQADLLEETSQISERHDIFRSEDRRMKSRLTSPW